MSALPQLKTSSRGVISEELPRRQIQLKCPDCSRDLGAFDTTDPSASAVCPGCRFTVSNQEGIWRSLAPGRQERFRRFVREYQKVRALEGRGSPSPDFYLKLPYEDITGRHRWQWNVRGSSFRFFETKILPQIENAQERDLDVLDLGAGNCWLSYRLALRRHRPMAVDLIDNVEDGLGAARHYLPHLQVPLVRFQAEMDRLPFQDRQFDLAIFNASFHYSEDYHATLGEALRCLRRTGHLIIMDSPFYKRPESGDAMVKERRAIFSRQFGFASDSLPSREYLTTRILNNLADAFHLSWRVAKPWHGLQWSLRPLKAWLLRRREPSNFFIFWTAV